MGWSSTVDQVLRSTQRAFRVEGSVVYTPPEGAPVQLEDVILHVAAQVIDAESGLTTSIRRPRARVLLADLPAGEAVVDALLECPPGAHPSYPAGVTWLVEGIEPDGEGGVELALFEVLP